ncbi:MAG TPA: hypothetical protein VFW41_03125 [Gaiellaceae bacterium]|nr:hypothetical protein [Gaiellaceae bacterium]
MRRLFTWVAGAAGGVAAYRAVTRRKPAPEAVPAEADPVQELRAKLAEARSEPEPEPAGPDDPDARRRDVHEQARAALDEMRDET